MLSAEQTAVLNVFKSRPKYSHHRCSWLSLRFLRVPQEEQVKSHSRVRSGNVTRIRVYLCLSKHRFQMPASISLEATFYFY